MEASKQILKGCRELVESGLIARTWGNVSCRIDNEYFLITPSGMDYNSITEDDLVKVRIRDLNYEGNIKPSSEKGIHGNIYRLRKEAKFVVHTHQKYASAISALGKSKIHIERDREFLREGLMCSKYALPSTKRLCKNVTQALISTDNKSIIMNNHGTICYGKTYEEAFNVVNELEMICRDMVGDINERKESESKESAEKLVSQLKFTDKERENMVLNTTEWIKSVSEEEGRLGALLDDYAQLLGRGCKIIPLDIDEIRRELDKRGAVIIKGIGAVCRGRNSDESEALSMVIEKNSTAMYCARKFGKVKHINPLECTLMRVVYSKSYSKKKYGK